jgi:hypothetical protein
MKVLKDSGRIQGCPKIGEVLRKTYQRREGQAGGTLRLHCFQLVDRCNPACCRDHDGRARSHEKPTLHFYAATCIGGTVTPTSQKYLDKCVELFEAVGLRSERARQLSMTSLGTPMAWSYHWCVQPPTQRRACETTVRTAVLEECEVCGLEMQLRTSRQHTESSTRKC